MLTAIDQQLYQFLLQSGIVAEKDLVAAAKRAGTDQISLQQVLLDQDYLNDASLGKIVADLYGLPFVRLEHRSIPQQALLLIPELVARHQGVMAFAVDKDGVHVATIHPENKTILQFLQKKIDQPLVIHYATPRDLSDMLDVYAKDIGVVFAKMISQQTTAQHQQDKNKIGEEPPIIQIVQLILSYAERNKASDVHIEPERERSLVRFRIDGVLHDVVTLPLAVHTSVVTRIKVMSKLRTDEHQSAQDGKLMVTVDQTELDVRVSIVPIITGEKVVMRLLSDTSRRFSLRDLGFDEADLAKVQVAAQLPHGMILSTGPTGCGKTTTIYSILKILNQREVNIMTIEDPVEYDISGINQIQVNARTNLTFAAGLRSIVRQDPDIIFVGEIRDEETAGIAINAALTGHLVLSTLHTNDAVTTLPRFWDMGAEPYLVASTVSVVIGQRLVRRICQACRLSETINLDQELHKFGLTWSKSLTEKYFPNPTVCHVYHGKGCPVCHGTGYSGRVGIFEVLVVDDVIREAIMARKDSVALKKIASQQGMKTMLEDGIAKIQQGLTTIEEVLRATKE